MGYSFFVFTCRNNYHNSKIVRLKIIISVIAFSTFISCNALKNGVFELEENKIITSTIYRDKNYQIEVSKNDTTIANIKWLSNKKFILQGIEKNPNEIEKLKFLVSHSKINNNSFLIEAITIKNNLDYSFQGVIVKTNLKIEGMFQQKLDSLNGNLPRPIKK